MKYTLASIIGKTFCFREWIDNLEKLEIPHEETKLLWVVTQEVRNEVEDDFERLAERFGDCELVESPFRFYSHAQEATSPEGFLKKRWGVAFNMNIINQHRKGDLFIVEDDIFPPPEAFSKLSTLIRIPGVFAATGCARTVRTRDSKYTSWMFVKKRVISIESIEEIRKTVPNFDFYDYEIITLPDGEGVEDIHASGTVCTYICEDVIKDYIFVGESNLFSGQDVNLGWHITQKNQKRFLVDWSVKCAHWHKDELNNITKRT